MIVLDEPDNIAKVYDTESDIYSAFNEDNWVAVDIWAKYPDATIVLLHLVADSADHRIEIALEDRSLVGQYVWDHPSTIDGSGNSDNEYYTYANKTNVELWDAATVRPYYSGANTVNPERIYYDLRNTGGIFYVRLSRFNTINYVESGQFIDVVVYGYHVQADEDRDLLKWHNKPIGIRGDLSVTPTEAGVPEWEGRDDLVAIVRYEGRPEYDTVKFVDLTGPTIKVQWQATWTGENGTGPIRRPEVIGIPMNGATYQGNDTLADNQTDINEVNVPSRQFSLVPIDTSSIWTFGLVEDPDGDVNIEIWGVMRAPLVDLPHLRTGKLDMLVGNFIEDVGGIDRQFTTTLGKGNILAEVLHNNFNNWNMYTLNAEGLPYKLPTPAYTIMSHHGFQLATDWYSQGLDPSAYEDDCIRALLYVKQMHYMEVPEGVQHPVAVGTFSKTIDAATQQAIVTSYHVEAMTRSFTDVNDLKMYLSGGASNTVLDNSIGGAISTTLVSAGTGNVYPDIDAQASQRGEQHVFCFYLTNESVETAYDVKISVLTQPDTGSIVGVGLGAGGIDTTEPTMSLNHYVPDGVDFNPVASFISSATLDSLPAGSSIGVWLKRDTVLFNEGVAASNNFTVEINVLDNGA